MKIYYIYHSCFIVETESSFLIFDYFKHDNECNVDFKFNELINKIIESVKPLYVFSSHSHQDHFNYDILSWSNEKENTYYILSSDIKLYEKKDNAYTVCKDEDLSINNLKINTFGSTDAGISFIVNVDGLIIFHAGDLNWWKWMDDTDEEEAQMENAFKKIIKDIMIKDINMDIAFFPVDGRLEDNYSSGGKYFIEQLNPKIFIPMHFWDNFNITTNFKKSMSQTQTEIIEIKHNNEILLS